MSSSTHQIKVKATDQTSGAFSSIQKRAAAVGSGIKNALGGALAAAGAYLGASAFVSGIKELGSLSDTAQKASVSVDELTKASTAMSVLGIKGMGVEQMANAFSEMEKKTGRTGMSGFYQTIEELGKINDASQRAALSMEIFGESGKNLIPLINAADVGTQALQDVVDVMPGIPQSAADAGDETADAMETISNGVKSLWYSAIGEIVSWFNSKFTGGIREAAATASNSLIYYAKVAFLSIRSIWTQITNFSEKLGGAIGTLFGSLANGASIKEAWNMVKDDWNSTTIGQQDLLEKQDAEDRKRIEKWTQDYRNTQEKIKRLNKQYGKSVMTTRDRIKRDLSGLLNGEVNQATSSTMKTKISNSLIMGGSNEATKLSILGPQTNELKKVNTTLDKIKNAVEQTARNTRKNDTTTGIAVKPI